MDAHRILLPATLSVASLEAVADELERAERDDSARVWLLAGSDGTFCRGMDLATYADSGGSEAYVSLRQFVSCLSRLRHASRPTIALVDGVVQGGGVGIAAACDVVLATPRSTFALPEALFGLLPGVVLPVVLERMPLQKARLLTLLGGSRDAAGAAAPGLVDEVVEEAEIAARAARLARELGRVSSARVKGLRSWLYEAALLPPEAALARGSGVTAQLVRDERVRAAVKAFLEDGTPPWEQS